MKKRFKFDLQSLKKRTFRVVIQASVTFLFLEILLLCLTKMGIINMITPTYDLPEYGYFSPERSNLFGYHHSPNSTYKINKSCFSTDYSFNSLGFRDHEHKKLSKKPRVAVIGDSFMEGLGVAENERLSSLLEDKTGIEHMNFSTSNIGTTQEYVIYNSIASQYNHDIVLWSLFPFNDFNDDNPAQRSKDNIAPCWIGEFPNYQLTFVPKWAPQIKRKSFFSRLLKNFTYTYNAAHLIKESVFNNREYEFFGYFNYSKAQIDRMKYSIIKLKEAAQNKKIVIVSIPSNFELSYTTDQKKQEIIETELMTFCSELDIEFIGLYQYFKKTKSAATDLYLECDSHWNAQGHKKAMKILLEHSQTYKDALNLK